jgi:acetyl-CoA synthetase
MADNLSQLLATPLQPLREQWRSPAQAELLRTARDRHEQSPDAYWAWVAERQTETGSTWTYPVAGVEALKPGSTGTAVPGHVYEIVDDNGKPVPPGTKGNLVLTQPFPTLARTVWDDPGRYQHAYFTRFPGCYCTNDEAVLDDDGHLWVLGRADDVINVAAHRISTMEIEAIATAHPQVAEAAVVGVFDATKGTVPVGFLTLLDGADPGQVKQEVSDQVASQLGGYARLGAVYLTSALPKTRTGKIMRRLLRDIVEHGAPQGDTSAMDDVAGLQAVQQAGGASPPAPAPAPTSASASASAAGA